MSSAAFRVEKLKAQIADFTLLADFRVELGERLALIGRSGGGKSSLLRRLAGLDPLREGDGRLWIGEREITDLPPEKRDIGLVFQDQALFPALNVLENVTFGLRVRGVPARERMQTAREWLERFGMESQAERDVGSLSGGERQRVAFLRAVIWKPKVLLLDEPFSSLDPSLRSQIRQELVRIHGAHPVPLVFVTHDSADVAEVATSKLELSEKEAGKLRYFVR